MRSTITTTLLILSLVAAGCSSEASDQATTPASESSEGAVSVGADAAPESSSAAPSTTAPEAAPTTASTTTTVAATTIPRALAFTSADDVGTFFETVSSTGMLITSAEAGGAAGDEILEDGTVVKAIETVELNGYQWVLVGTPIAGTKIGWLLAEDLLETEQMIESTDVGARGRYHQVVAGSEQLVLHIEPDVESEVLGSHATGEIVLHSGDLILTPGGETWAKLIDPDNLSTRGWVNAAFLSVTSGVQVHNSDGTPALSSRGNWDSGARINAPIKRNATCAFVQLEISTTGSGTVSSHVMYGSSAPTSPDDGQPEFQQWNMGSDTNIVYIRPGSSVMFTLPAHPAHTYYFMALGPEHDAPFVADADGAPILDVQGRMVASDFITFTADGTC